MKQSKRIFLIRHTSPAVAKGVCYGSSNVLLAESYETERQAIEQKCQGFLPDAVFCSPLERCNRLAVDLFGGADLRIDSRLQEMHFGDWEMMRWDDIRTDDIDAWSKNFYEIATPNGESFRELHHRVRAVWQDEIVAHEGQNLAVVTHSGVIRSLLMDFLDIPHQKVFNLALSFGATIEVNWQSETMYNVHFR
jgi:alpha-ribazole phosphatase